MPITRRGMPSSPKKRASSRRLDVGYSSGSSFVTFPARRVTLPFQSSASAVSPCCSLEQSGAPPLGKNVLNVRPGSASNETTALCPAPVLVLTTSAWPRKRQDLVFKASAAELQGDAAR